MVDPWVQLWVTIAAPFVAAVGGMLIGLYYAPPNAWVSRRHMLKVSLASVVIGLPVGILGRFLSPQALHDPSGFYLLAAAHGLLGFVSGKFLAGRTNDIGISKWINLLLFMPILQLGFILFLLAKKGRFDALSSSEEKDWALAAGVYPNVVGAYQRLLAVDISLALEFQRELLKSKNFADAEALSENWLRQRFAVLFAEKEIQEYAFQLVQSKNDVAVAELINLARVLGNGISLKLVEGRQHSSAPLRNKQISVDRQIEVVEELFLRQSTIIEYAALLSSGCAVGFVHGRYRRFETMHDLRASLKDFSEWQRVTDHAEHRSQFNELVPVLTSLPRANY